MGAHDELDRLLDEARASTIDPTLLRAELELARRERTAQAAYAVRLEDALHRLYRAASCELVVAALEQLDGPQAGMAAGNLAAALDVAGQVLPSVMGERPSSSSS